MDQNEKSEDSRLNINRKNNQYPPMSSDLKVNKSDIFFSLYSNKSPGHTFTPVMRRPKDNDINLPTLEEQQTMQKETNNTPSDSVAETNQSKVTGFTFPPVLENNENTNLADQEQVTLATDPRLTTTNNSESEEVKHTVETQTPPQTLGAERVIPQASQSHKHKSDSEETKILPKYRRLLVVILIILALLLVFFLLKPKTPETIESLQEQGTSLPIEFRPVDEEEAKRAEEEAKALQLQAQQATEQAASESLSDSQEIALNIDSNGDSSTSSTIQSEEQQTASQPMPSNETSTVADRPVNVAPVERPSSNGSVIHREETPVVRNTQRNVTRESSQTNTRTSTSTSTKQARTTSNTSTKTMTVPKGVSLMQVFRDNNLNIADVNAMSKTNNIVSNLRVGEKITVRLDKNNRVVEMSIGSAGKFTRQANGSYTYK